MRTFNVGDKVRWTKEAVRRVYTRKHRDMLDDALVVEGLVYVVVGPVCNGNLPIRRVDDPAEIGSFGANPNSLELAE